MSRTFYNCCLLVSIRASKDGIVCSTRADHDALDALERSGKILISPEPRPGTVVARPMVTVQLPFSEA